MSSLLAAILVVSFLAYLLWDWIWHIAVVLCAALLMYLAWPSISQSKPWEDFVAWLRQLEVPKVSAMPSDRLYVSPLAKDESRDRFEPLGREEYPRPYPRPILLDRRRGVDVFGWKGECWFLRHNEEPYRFLCVVHGRLQWCWPARPYASAVPCRSRDTGEDGWCWKNEVSYRNDS